MVAESMLIFAPNANSYRRFRRNSYAPVSASWGINNRTVSLRIPAGPPKACHIEHRPSGVDANPYLVASTVLAGIARGLDDKLDPRNFQRRVVALGMVEETGEVRAGEAHRPARLYRFRSRKPHELPVLSGAG